MDFNSVQGKVVIVTGASRGIGRAIAECYGAHGMKVACAARSVDQGQAVSDGICAKGGEAIFIQTDCIGGTVTRGNHCFPFRSDLV